MNTVQPHHLKKDVCYKRPIYREARWERAIKVYTINQESKYLLVQGVPQVGVSKELIKLFGLYGEVDEYRLLHDYPTEKFTEVFWIKYRRIQSARFGKKKLDNQSFFGGLLHVCYAPEYESKNDTKEKLLERRRAVVKKCKEYNDEIKMQNCSKSLDDSHQSKICHDAQFSSLVNKTTILSNASVTHPASLTSTPINLTPLIPPPPSFPTSSTLENTYQLGLPRVSSKQATLPTYLQNLSAIEVYPKYFESITHITDKERNFIIKDKVENDKLDQTDINIPGKETFDEPVCKKKGIVWNPKFNKKLDENSLKSTTINPHPYTKTPGAWDPYREYRVKSSEKCLSVHTEDKYDRTVNNIRDKLLVTMEAKVQLPNECTECPLQSITKLQKEPQLQQLQQQQQESHTSNSSTRKRNVNRKRI